MRRRGPRSPDDRATEPVSDVRAPRVEIDGRTATVEEIWLLDLSTAGHFTAMQIRGRATLGMDFHLARLDAATRELFGVGLDGARVLDCIRHALADDISNASVRVNVFRPDADGGVSVVVSVRPPAPAPAQGQHLQTTEYRRPVPHIKRATGFGQSYFGDFVRAKSADEALNVGFIEPDTILWPDAPALRGVMMQVLQRELERAGVPWRSAPVHVAELASFDGAFVTNSRGMATVARIDDLTLPTDASLMRTAMTLLAAAPYDPI
jgi:branched-subunit amino acid aminotransferase/4-amino-4-deoxychorismate lyase